MGRHVFVTKKILKKEKNGPTKIFGPKEFGSIQNFGLRFLLKNLENNMNTFMPQIHQI